MRRPENLPALCLPTAKYGSLREDVHTPIPFTPFPLAMTPDTPSFSFGSFDSAGDVPEKHSFEVDGSSSVESDGPWSEEDEGLAQSYIMNPPRPLRTSYPPGTLPPPAALDEITSQLLQSSSNNSRWSHNWLATRRKVFTIARRDSMEATGGHRRKISDIIPITAAPSQTLRPRVEAIGGAAMNRQQHSMDSFEEGRSGFSEALRLSSTLQDSARDSQTVLASTGELSSPMAFTFNFAPAPAVRKTSFPFASTSAPRPASLLQRGRSFTSEDFAREHGLKPLIEDEVVVDHDETVLSASPPDARPEMRRSVSSPLSTFASSPPSSISSLATDFEPDMEMEPYTPLNQTSFPASALMMRDASDNSTSTVTTPSGTRTPSITVTMNSPQRSPGKRSTPRLPSANDSPTPAFAALSLNAPVPLVFPTPQPKKTSSSSQGVKRSIKPAILARSLSESATLTATKGNANGNLLGFSQIHPSGRETKRHKALGFSAAPSRFKPGPGLSVLVPKPGTGALGLGFAPELRSPFEPKPVSQ